MKKQQNGFVQPNERGVVMAGQECIHGMTNTNRQQLHDLTLLRIERNRAARHARCAIIRK